MGRTKLFSREDILEKSLPLFWKKGFSNTSLQELEQATGVNKSGLYSEFKDKDEIFTESLKFYLAQQNRKLVPSKDTLGWRNIQKFFSLISKSEESNPKGCFMVNSFRELSSLPKEVRINIEKAREKTKAYIVKNLKVEKVQNPETMAEVILTFFSGLAIEQNLNAKESEKKISIFLKTLQA